MSRASRLERGQVRQPFGAPTHLLPHRDDRQRALRPVPPVRRLHADISEVHSRRDTKVPHEHPLRIGSGFMHWIEQPCDTFAQEHPPIALRRRRAADSAGGYNEAPAGAQLRFEFVRITLHLHLLVGHTQQVHEV